MGSSLQPWTMDALLSLRVPSNIQLSPDGRIIVFDYGSHFKLDKDTPATGALFLVDTRTQLIRHFAGDDHSHSGSARWSPEGSRLAFVSDRANRSEAQLFVMPFAGGEAEQITHLRGAINSPIWLPDGSRLVFLSSGVAAETTPPAPDPVIEDGDLHFARVWIADVVVKEARPVTPGDLNIYDYALSADGQWLALVAAPHPTREDWYYAQLYVTEIATGQTRQVCVIDLQIGIPAFSPDSQQIAFIAGTMSDQGAVAGDIYSVPRTGGQARNLTASLDHSPTWLIWPEGGITYGARQVNGTRIGQIDPVSGAIIRLINRRDAIGGMSGQRFSLAADGQTFATVIDSFEQPLTICIGHLATGNIQPLSDLFQEVKGYAAPHVEYFDWQAPDGTPVEGWLQYPNHLEVGKPFPMVVEPHGGPSASYIPNFCTGTRAWRHVLADHGIGTFMPNPRGSWGRGEAYQSANVGDLGGGDWQDITAGIDMLVGRGLADADRLGIFGWSYGGYLTAWAVTQTTRFKCAVAGAAITNFESNYGLVSNRAWQSTLMGSYPYDQPEQHRARSPLTFIKNVTTPTLLVHGEYDIDVPVGQAIEFYTALKHFGVTTQCVTYPREPHGFIELAHQRDMTNRAIAWLERFLLGTAHG